MRIPLKLNPDSDEGERSSERSDGCPGPRSRGCCRNGDQASLVQTGTVVSLSHDLLTERVADAPEPFVLNVEVPGNFVRDRLEIGCHSTTDVHAWPAPTANVPSSCSKSAKITRSGRERLDSK